MKRSTMRLFSASTVLAGVRRDEDVGQVPKGIVLGERLHQSDIEGGAAQPAATERLDHGALVDHLPAGDVDQEGVWRQGGQLGRADQPLGRLGQGAGQDQGIDLAEASLKLSNGKMRLTPSGGAPAAVLRTPHTSTSRAASRRAIGRPMLPRPSSGTRRPASSLLV